MAYASRRYARRPRRSLRTSRYRRTRGPRRVRRTTFRRRGTSKRRILNVSSKKKRDNMINVSFSPTGINPAVRGFIATGAAPTMLVWCATARDRVSNASNPTADSVRESQTCYMRGLKEHIRINTNNPTSWLWRRICFTAKGLFSGLGTSADSVETSNGWVRALMDQTGTSFGTSLTNLLFAGTNGVDWNDTFTANTDSTNVKIMYDKTFTINSGVSGVIRDYKMWHGMNKNIVYGEDENGEGEINNRYSTIGRPGMGDYYVVDLLASNSSAAADTLTFSTEATLYWHEK
ncbi:putative coat protein [Dragonfly-associated circular virus 3]|uniref:Putative coat protein n=1 Tax=Dragonfly-associated circular virus 3 TaxID=1234884 RepID=K0A169_9VIRU|nr:putative coat protein [Dragonfly-associated circular virus 3]AFS65305.1 putative coat protein [Dragonfly-associated circular virus 3]